MGPHANPKPTPQSRSSAGRAIRGRLVGLLVSSLLLVVFVRKADPSLLLSSLKRASIPWLLVSFSAFGLTTLGMSARWHLMAREAEVVVHARASWAVCTIGHFFNTLLFGPMGGDTAKTAIYHRYFQLPFVRIATACVFDRFLGLVSSILMGLMILPALAWANLGGVTSNLKLTLTPQHAMALGGAVIAFLLWRILRKPKRSARARWLKRGLKPFWLRLKQNPRSLVLALSLGLGIQLVWCGLLGLNLKAVTQTDVPWLSILWTFPLIGFIASTPLTIAGAGLREGAALFFLSLYSIPAADVAAAAVLTFLTYFAWALVGLGLFLKAERRFQAAQPRPLAPKSISIVIPTLNEAEELPATLVRLAQVPEITEIIVSDAGSTDTTEIIAKQFGCNWVSSPKGRGAQMHLGGEKATGDVVLFLHADTWLPAHAGKAILQCLRDPTTVGGGFWKRFRAPTLLMRGSRLKCASRCFLGGLVLGDQGIFVRRHALEAIGGFPNQPLMEEYELCRLLLQRGRLNLAPATVVTSDRKFHRLGPWRTYLRMWRVTLAYHLGASPARLARIYERPSP